MHGPISTSEAAGPAQQAASLPFRSPSVGPPEKVPPVSESNRPRSSGRDEAGLPGKVNQDPEFKDRKVEMGGPEKTQSPPTFVERRPGGSSAPPPHVALAEALAAAKARWVEVNQEVLEANTLPGHSLPDSPHVEVNDGLQRRLAIHYENLATSLSNPHPTKPVIDLFV